MPTSSCGGCGLRRETCYSSAEHSVESFLGDKSRAQKHNDVRANAAKTAESFFAVHERHR